MSNLAKKLQKRIKDLQNYCKALGKGLRNLQKSSWGFSEADDYPTYFDSQKLRQFFDRSEITSDYMKAKEEGTKQDLALAKQQNDILSALERDFIARRRTRLEKLAIESVFRNHAGSNFGVFQLNWLAYFESQMRRK